jgi:hypothetical protein
MNETTGTTIVEKEGHGSWNALWALGGFAAGYLVNGGRFGNGCGGNCNGNCNGCGGCGGSAPVASAAAASAYYNEGIMAGENRAGLNYATQAITNGNQEMRAGFAQMNAQFTNILDREYQKVLAENTALKSNNALCAAMNPLSNSITSLTGTVNCIREAFNPGYVRSVPLCSSINTCSTCQ